MEKDKMIEEIKKLIQENKDNGKRVTSQSNQNVSEYQWLLGRYSALEECLKIIESK